MPTVVVNDDPMIRAETLETVLGETATVVTADLQTTDDIIEAAADAAALVVDVQTDVPAEVFEACGALDIVARAGVGADGVDIPAAADPAGTVVNVHDCCREAVSTYDLPLLLA